MSSILIVDDDKTFLFATAEILEMLGHVVKTAFTVEEAKKWVETDRFTHVILDLFLPDGSGFNVVDALSGAQQDVKIALITGHPSVKSIGMKLHGPNITYFLKPLDLEQLKSFLISDEIERTEDTSGITLHFGCLVGESPEMHQVYAMINRVALTNANVMLMGESGVGKEVVASAIHRAGAHNKPFVAANCGAFARDLIGSELFGHEKGAFTGATHRKAGVFELAKDGTLFLDEITEMPIDLQPNLLRALETKRITRLGATSQTDIACRVVSATNRSENDIARDNCLREDLYFRLAVFPIKIPALRERKDDIELLTRHFLADFNEKYNTEVGIDNATWERIRDYDWPGNVRELRHAVHRAYIMADADKQVIQLPDNLASPFSKNEQVERVDDGLVVGKTVSDVEQELIQKTLEHFQGDKKRAADTLGISLKTLYNKLNSYIGG